MSVKFCQERIKRMKDEKKAKYASYRTTLDCDGHIKVKRLSPVVGEETTWLASDDAKGSFEVCICTFNARSEEEAEEKFKGFLKNLQAKRSNHVG